MAKINSPLLGNKTLQIRTNPRFKLVIREPVPWDKRRGGLAARSPNQVRVNETLAELSRTARDVPWNQRRIAISAAMKGLRFGGEPRVRRTPLSQAGLNDLINRLRGIAQSRATSAPARAVTVTVGAPIRA